MSKSEVIRRQQQRINSLENEVKSLRQQLTECRKAPQKVEDSRLTALRSGEKVSL